MGRGKKVGITAGVIIVIFLIIAVIAAGSIREATQISEFDVKEKEIVIGISDNKNEYNKFEGKAFFVLTDGSENKLREWDTSFEKDDFKIIEDKPELVLEFSKDKFKGNEFENPKQEGRLDVMLNIDNKNLTSHKQITLLPDDSPNRLKSLSIVTQGNKTYLTAKFFVERTSLKGVSCDSSGLLGKLLDSLFCSKYSTNDALMMVSWKHLDALKYYFEKYNPDSVTIILETDMLDEYGNKQNIILYDFTYERQTFDKINKGNFRIMITQNWKVILTSADNYNLYV